MLCVCVLLCQLCTHTVFIVCDVCGRNESLDVYELARCLARACCMCREETDENAKAKWHRQGYRDVQMYYLYLL